MSESVPPLSAYALKGQARELIGQSRAGGGNITHAQALEKVARMHGFSDWNSAEAAAGKHSPAKANAPVDNFTAVEIPPLLEWVQVHDCIGGAINGIVRARELETIADSARDGAHAGLLS